MKTYKDITKRYLSKNKGRTITTMCGIILSIALITAIMFFVRGIHQSFLDREINASGEYHISFTGLSKDEISKMSLHPGIKNLGMFNEIGIITASNGEYDYKFSLSEVTSGQEHLFPPNIVEGRFGINETEIAIDSVTTKEMRKKIGDTISIDVNGEEKNYKIVGITDKPINYHAVRNGTAIISKDNISLGENTVIALEGKSKGLRKTLNELRTMTDKEVKENYYYLNYIGAGNNPGKNMSLFFIAVIIISLVIVSTVVVIRNAFYISIVSRLKDFGLLKSIGATAKQLRAMILKEATIIAFIAIPFGLFFGTLAVKVVEKVLLMMSDNVLVNIKIEWWILVIGAILGFITTYICAFIPALELKKISPLAAIDNRTGIKREKIRKKKYRFIEKFLNIRNIMAYRNIKRNKKRYNSTVLGLTISMIVFIVFTSYMRVTMREALGHTEGSMDMPDITSYFPNVEKTKVDALLNDLYKIDGASIVERDDGTQGIFGQIIKQHNLNKKLFDAYINPLSEQDIEEGFVTKELNTYMNKENINSEYAIFTPDIYSTNLNEGITSILNKYLIEGKVDLEYMKKNNGIIVVNEKLHHYESNYRGRVSNLKVGDKVYLTNYMELAMKAGESGEGKEYKKENTKEFEITAIVSELPAGLENFDYVVYNKNLESMLRDKNRDLLDVGSIQIRIKDTENYETIIEKIKNVFNKYSIEYLEQKELMKKDIVFISQIKLLIYGFIVVLGLISCTNIFNTMSTNVIFRKREIASLRAIGMSKKEVRNMIIKEGALYGIISAVYATIVGTIINFMLYKNLIAITKFKFIIHFDIIIFIAITGTLVGIVASLIPLRKIDHSSIIEGLKNE